MKEKDIVKILAGIVHPETGLDLVAGGMIKGLSTEAGRIRFTIVLHRAHDPFAAALKREAVQRLSEAFPGVETLVLLEEPAPKAAKTPEKKAAPTPGEPAGAAGKIGRVIAVASGKGGVGKSTVTARLALALAACGKRVGILDADIYGPSQPELFGVADYRPAVERIGDTDFMLPAVVRGVQVMSIGFFIDPSDALVWRGPMATSALRQLIHQTRWGELDYLLIDLPPGTGDVHLTVLQELKVSGAVIVTTPQGLAVADVVRGISMFRSEKIAVPVLGIVENMAWFTPAELPGNRYYIFGRGGGKRLAEAQGVPLLAEIPLVLAAGEGVSATLSASVDNPEAEKAYSSLAELIANDKNC